MAGTTKKGGSKKPLLPTDNPYIRPDDVPFDRVIIRTPRKPATPKKKG